MTLNPRREGLRHAREADLASGQGNLALAMESYSRAIGYLVDAFLADRRGNADLFVMAHRLGVSLENLGGCFWEIDEDRSTASDRCPIGALHSRLATSRNAGRNGEHLTVQKSRSKRRTP
jgi:hypothetical protein